MSGPGYLFRVSGSWDYVQMRCSIENLEREVGVLKKRIADLEKRGTLTEYQEPIFGPGHSQHAVPVEEVNRRAGSLLERIKRVDNG